MIFERSQFNFDHEIVIEGNPYLGSARIEGLLCVAQ